jgi:hypothetical protein
LGITEPIADVPQAFSFLVGPVYSPKNLLHTPDDRNLNGLGNRKPIHYPSGQIDHS